MVEHKSVRIISPSHKHHVETQLGFDHQQKSVGSSKPPSRIQRRWVGCWWVIKKCHPMKYFLETKNVTSFKDHHRFMLVMECFTSLFVRVCSTGFSGQQFLKSINSNCSTSPKPLTNKQFGKCSKNHASEIMSDIYSDNRRDKRNEATRPQGHNQSSKARRSK